MNFVGILFARMSIVEPIEYFLRINGVFVGIKNCTVVNANLDRVLTVMEKFLYERYRHVCNCPRCMSDIAAIALNYLPPHYIVDKEKCAEFGSPWVMVETAVTEAIDRVRENPNHPRAMKIPDRPVTPENIVS